MPMLPPSSSTTTKSSSHLLGRFEGGRKSNLLLLHAGLRDLVGPYDNDYEYGAASGPYIVGGAPSIRDERNSVLRNDRSFGSGGYASGGTGGIGGGGGGFGRRNSPGFIGFRGDRNYPAYDVVIDTPIRGGGGGGGRGSNSSTRRNARIFDNVDYDDLPSSSTRRINGNNINNNYDNGLAMRSNSDPYDRGLNSDFINTNGSPQRRGTRGGGAGRDSTGVYFDEFDAPPLPRRGGFRGRANVPQIYRRDLIDDGILDGRSFNSLTAVEQYFEAWNRRNIPLALSCFDDDVYYDDTQFSEPFEGKDKLANHLLYVAECLPDSFYFVVDELSVGRSSSQRSGRRRDRPSSPTFQMGRNRVALATRRAANAPSINIGALWHVENEFGPLPFARGCSFFKVDPNTNLIVEAYDFPEPAVIKTGSTGLKIFGLASKLTTEPKRLLPFFVWLAYIYIIFFSNGILPGKDIFHADAKTWKEIQDLSFNFMFIAPITHMPTAAKVNPVLEGIFNGLLAWSFLFAGFLSDERSGLGPYGKDTRYYERLMQNQEQVLDNGIVLIPPVNLTKKNLIPMVPTIVGMQFLTSAFMLPYLFARTTERYSSTQSLENRRYEPNLPRRIRPLYKEELDRPALVLGEWKGLGILLASIGIFAIYWGVAGRPEDFGPPIWVSDKRMVDFMKVLDSDRVASSFLVDFWVYGIFQGWLIDDDWKRRGRSLEEEKFLRNVAKFIPFFGLASYLIFRPQYPSSRDAFDYEAFFNARGSRRGGFSGRLNEGGVDRFDERDGRRNRF
jgi:hypothetical protein